MSETTETHFSPSTGSHVPPILGRYDKAMDKLGRVVLPEAIRSALDAQNADSTFVMCPWLDGCIGIFSAGEFVKVASRIVGDPARRYQQRHRNLLRYVGSYATRITYDKQGRFTMPDSLRELANIGSDVTFVGCFDMCEMWATPLFKDHIKKNGLQWDEFFESVLCESQAEEGSIHFSADDLPAAQSTAEPEA